MKGATAEDGATHDLAAAFDALVARAGPRLIGLALLLTGDRVAAEDVVQEALARVWRRRASLRDPHELDGYVARTVRHVAANRRERLAVEARALERSAVKPPTSTPGSRPDPEHVARAVASLPAEQREVVALRLYEELAFKDIAARVGAPLGTIHSRYRLALERLRPLLLGER